MATNSLERVSVNTFDKMAPKPAVCEIEIAVGEGESVTVQVKKRLSLYEMLDMVKFVVETCVDAENGEYIPEAYDFAMRQAVLTHYANFTMPSNLDKRYGLVYDSVAFDSILEVIDEWQFHAIETAINKKIEFMLSVISSTALAKVNEVIAKMGEFAEMSNEAFGSIDPKEVGEVMKGIAQLGGENHEDVVNKVVDTVVQRVSKDGVEMQTYEPKVVARG